MLIETATDYVLNLFIQNEEVKKLPAAFMDKAVKWAKSWFLKPDAPKENAKLEDPNKPLEVKKDIIQDILNELKENEQFMQELAEQLAAFATEKNRIKNAVIDADIDVQGNVHIGDKGILADENYDKKNIVEGSKIKAGGDFHLGDKNT